MSRVKKPEGGEYGNLKPRRTADSRGDLRHPMAHRAGAQAGLHAVKGKEFGGLGGPHWRTGAWVLGDSARGAEPAMLRWQVRFCSQFLSCSPVM